MKQLTCEMCGGTDLIKQDGVFVCQSCGCKYSVEEAKKMMIEGNVDVSGSTVKVDNSSNIENYLKLAENAYSANNNKEAENYSNKILEINPNYYKAWLIKGKAAGWQSTLNKSRIFESIECFEKAIDNVPEYEAAELKKEIAEEIAKLSKASLSLCCDIFVENPSKNNANLLVETAASINKSAIKLLEKCSIAPAKYEETTAICIRESAINAYDHIVWPEYSRSNGGYPYAFQFTNFLDKSSACIMVLKCSITMSSLSDKLDDVKIKNYKDLIRITTDRINAAGYEKKFNGSSSYWAVTSTLSASAKQINLDDIKTYHQKIKEIDPNYEFSTAEDSPKEKTLQKISIAIGVFVLIEIIVGLAIMFSSLLMDWSTVSQKILFSGIFIMAGGSIITAIIGRIVYEIVKKKK